MKLIFKSNFGVRIKIGYFKGKLGYISNIWFYQASFQIESTEFILYHQANFKSRFLQKQNVSCIPVPQNNLRNNVSIDIFTPNCWKNLIYFLLLLYFTTLEFYCVKAKDFPVKLFFSFAKKSNTIIRKNLH